MNKSIILLFLLSFWIAVASPAFAQPSNGTSPEGLKITKAHQQFVGEKRPESKVKTTTAGIRSKTTLPGTKKKCSQGGQPPECVW